MKSAGVLLEILQAAKGLAADLPRAMWNGFGSYFNEGEAFADVDVLVVCGTDEEAMRVRSRTSALYARWPIHLLIMTEDEAKETNFVRSQGCIRLFP